MKKEYFVLLLLLLVFSGCSGDGGSGGSSDMTDGYRTGTQGITMSFISENPPTEVYNTYPLVVMIEYRNLGASTVNSGKIYLSSFDRNYVPLSPLSADISGIEGKSVYSPTGSYPEIAEFNAPSINVQGIEDIDTFKQTIKATACYSYETIAYADVCIDPLEGRPTKTSKVCEVHSVSMSGGQGAPIAVTNIDESMVVSSTKQKVVFQITVKNTGGGEVFDISRGVDNCHSELENKDYDVVTVNEAKFSSYQLTCKPSKIRLDNGQGMTLCTAEGNFGETTYTTPLTIELGYGYRSSIQKTINIVNLD